PILATFNFILTAIIVLNAGVYTMVEKDANPAKVVTSPSNWKWDYSNTGLTMTINLIPCLTVGVGIRGLASAGIRARFQLTEVWGLTYRGDLDPDIYQLPHFHAGWAAQLSFVVSMFFFTSNFNLLNQPYEEIYDN
ncbi:MAG: hypothetical protein IJ092_14385, partial [Atopobiaceae bacterium]|nr:hypothetical protein [Atopobiaceae bacterium]